MENQSSELDQYYSDMWNHCHFSIIITGFIEITIDWIINIELSGHIGHFSFYWTFSDYTITLDWALIYQYALCLGGSYLSPSWPINSRKTVLI